MSATTITLSLEDYEALIALARQGTISDRIPALEQFLHGVETSNGLTRHTLFIRWQDPKAPLPKGTNFPKTWPPYLSFLLELISRPICKADVLSVVSQRSPTAVSIMVTPDPAGLVGWTELDAFFPNG